MCLCCPLVNTSQSQINRRKTTLSESWNRLFNMYKMVSVIFLAWFIFQLDFHSIFIDIDIDKVIMVWFTQVCDVLFYRFW